MILTRTKLRPAVQEDIPTIMKLLADNELLIGGLDWSEIDNSWWIAEHKGKPVGCMQVLPGKPLGAFLHLAVAPEYHGSGVGVQLLKSAEILLGMQGCDGFISCTQNEVILKRLKDWNTTDIGTGHMIVKRVRRYTQNAGTYLNLNRH